MEGRKAWQSMPKESREESEGMSVKTLAVPSRSPCSYMSDRQGIKLKGSHKIPEVFIFLRLH